MVGVLNLRRMRRKDYWGLRTGRQMLHPCLEVRFWLLWIVRSGFKIGLFVVKIGSVGQGCVSLGRGLGMLVIG